MKHHSKNCAICGGNTSKRILRVGVPANRPEILLLWKQEYVKSLCDILFGSDFQSVFHEYFEHGSYCSDCLQLLWNIDFTWKLLLEKKREIQKQSAAVVALLERNYYNRKNKSKAAIINDRIASLHNNEQDNNYSANEVLEMIYSAIQSKQGIKKESKNADPEEKVEYVVEVKEENMESEFLNEYSQFDSGGEDWLTENAADEPVLTVPVILRKRKKKPKESDRIKRTRHATKRYEMNQGESGSDEDFQYEDSQSKDADYKPPSRPTIAKKPQPKTSKELEIHRRRKQDLQQLVYELSDVSESTDNESNNEDNFKSITRKARKFKMGDFKCYLNSKKKEPKRRIGRPDLGLQTDIVLEDFEKLIIQKLTEKNLKFFQLKKLEESELNLAKKLSLYSNTSIRRLQLPAQQQNTALNLRHKVLDKKRKDIVSQKRNKKFPCEKENCNAKLNSEEELEAHIREIHEGEKLPFYCTTCPKKCSTYSNVKSHRQKCHKGVKRFYYHFCKLCQQGYKTEDELKGHLESAHQGPNPYNCAFCTEEYLTSLHLIRHVSEAHFELTPEESEKVQKQTCKKCGKWFMKESHLQRHLLHHENDEKPKNVNSVNCDHCQKSFTSEGSLQYHVYFCHTYIVCELCGKSVRKSSFGEHERRHTGELRFACSICGKRYRTNSQVSDHERIHSGIRSFVCSVCGKSFFTRSVLAGHEKTHEPGYVPRKPFRRTRPNRKKKIPKEIPVSEDHSNDDNEGSWKVNFEQGEPSYSHARQENSSNSATVRQPQLVAHENIYTHPPGFLYPL